MTPKGNYRKAVTLSKPLVVKLSVQACHAAEYQKTYGCELHRLAIAAASMERR